MRNLLNHRTISHRAVLLGLALVAGFFAASHSLHAQELIRDYERRITDREIRELEAGASLDESDVDYCEKARDVCLGALCGTLDQRTARKGCWSYCTKDAYQSCQERMDSR